MITITVNELKTIHLWLVTGLDPLLMRLLIYRRTESLENYLELRQLFFSLVKDCVFVGLSGFMVSLTKHELLRLIYGVCYISNIRQRDNMHSRVVHKTDIFFRFVL